MAKRKTKAQTPPPPDEAVDQATGLNPKQELFCRYYTQNDETFGNATLSYAAAYGYDLDSLSDQAETETDDEGNEIKVGRSEYDRAANVCAVEGARLLRSPKVQQRKIVLLNELLKDEVVDSELAKVIKQDRKLDPKVAAVREYNRLRGRVVDKSQVTQVQKLDMDDIRVLISGLPQERQDEFYATITNILAEADQLRGGGSQSAGSNSQRPGEHTA